MKKVAKIIGLAFLTCATNVALGQAELSRDQKELMELLKDDLEQRPRTKFLRPQNQKTDEPSKFRGIKPSTNGQKYKKYIDQEQTREKIKYRKPNPKDDWYDEGNYDATSKLRTGTQASRAKKAFQDIYAEDRNYGKFRFGIGVGKFQYSDEQTNNVLEAIYGSTNVFPKIDVEYTPFDWIVGVGAHLSLGLYRQSGKAVSENSTPDNIIEDPSGSRTKLKFYPLQLGVSARYSPFPRKLIVVDGKLAFERLFAREVRDIGASSGEDSYVTKASKNAVVFGLGASISLNGLSQRAVSTMRSSVRLGYVYLRAYYELSAQMATDQGANFSRNTFGLSIVAETF